MYHVSTNFKGLKPKILTTVQLPRINILKCGKSPNVWKLSNTLPKTDGPEKLENTMNRITKI